MSRRIGLLTLLIALSAVSCGRTPDVGTVLDNAATTMGAANLTSVEFSGSGSQFSLGQSPSPGAPWPRFNAQSYSYAANYATPAAREELVRTQALDPPRGGGQQPLPGEQRIVQLVSGDTAWNLNVADNTPTAQPGAAQTRLALLWLTPHGFIKAAQAGNATLTEQTVEGRRLRVVSFAGPTGKPVNGYLNEQGFVEKVETWIDNPVLGDMHAEAEYSDYRDFGGVQFPTRIVHRQGGHPVLDLTISDVRPNSPVDIPVPEAVRAALSAPPAPTVNSQRVARGVYYLTGGSHHSVAVEFSDFVTVIEGPQNDARAMAVIAEVKRLFPNKPIRYLVNTHHHFDHSGGVRAFVAEGATVVTHDINGAFYQGVLTEPRTINPDRLAQSPMDPTIETFIDTRVITDGTRRLELHHIAGNQHNDGLIMAYLPAEGILVEADAFTPAAPGAPAPSRPNPFSVNLNENIERLRLNVRQILPLHGRAATMADLRRAIGRT